jgi:hypothetical protein
MNICEICFSKKKTYELLSSLIKTPKIYNITDILENDFPLFIKPECGYGSRNSLRVNNINELNFYNNHIENLIICEYLPNEEYTIDCFSSKKNGLIFCKARTRSKTLNGMSILTKMIDLPEAKIIGQKIHDIFGMKGAWFFQLKRDINQSLTLLEIAPRIPGAMCLHRVSGINFPLLSIYEHYNYDIDSLLINNNDISCYKYFENNYKINIEYDYVYIDLDDTIIIKNKVNLKIIQFLYQCKNKGKQIFLITKNPSPLDYLEKYAISKSLFFKIISCKKTELKTDFIENYEKSIFIDDSFEERRLVYNLGIPVFNCDMVEVLMDNKL